MNQDGRLGLRLFWILVALGACWLQGRSFLENLRPTNGVAYDFFQEWASARNHFEGLPIYTHQAITLERYREALHRRPDLPSVASIQYNAHPPTSVLLALPLARLDYPDAFLIWSVLSLLALTGSLGLVLHQHPNALSVWAILPLAALLLWCNPFRQQMIMGQLNLILLLLFAGSWAADRTGRSWTAGALLGVATAIKLFPGYLFLYFVMRRQWRPLVAGVVSFLALTGLTVAVLGAECYRDYVTGVLPSLTRYRVDWPNLSLMGFWHKLFNSQGSHVIPLWQNPLLAWTATLLSDVVVTGLTAWLIWRSRSPRQRDLAFSLTIIAMLLVSPITWDHYFTLLFLPLFLLWFWTSPSEPPRVLFWCLLIGLWLQPLFFWRFAFPGVNHENWQVMTATPRQTLTVLSIQTYILLALFLFTILVIRRSAEETKGASTNNLG